MKRARSVFSEREITLGALKMREWKMQEWKKQE